jgi:hypothetical protein
MFTVGLILSDLWHDTPYQTNPRQTSKEQNYLLLYFPFPFARYFTFVRQFNNINSKILE